MSDKSFNFKIVTPHETIGPLPCDSLKISISDGKNDNAGGSYGIRRGHAEALFALDNGLTEAFSGGKSVFSAETSVGFVKVSRDLVTIVVDSIRLNS